MDMIGRKKILMHNQPQIFTATGGVVSFDTNMSAPLKSCKVEFTPIQEGTGDPSPENVRPITGWDEILIYKNANNVLDPSLLPSPNNGRYVYWDTGETIFWSNSYNASDYVPVIGGNAYILHAEFYGQARGGFAFYDSEKNYISGQKMERYINNIPIIAPNNASYIRFSDNISLVPTEDVHLFSCQTHAVTLPTVGKNICNGSLEYGAINISTGEEISANNRARTPNYMRITPLQTYTVSATSSNSLLVTVYGFDEDYNLVGVARQKTLPYTFTFTKPQIKYIRLMFAYESNINIDNLKNIQNIQVELGSSATSFEEFKPIYGGYVDLITGEVASEWVKYNITDYTWNKWGSGGLMYVNHTNVPRITGTTVYCNSASIDGTGDPQRKAQDVIGYYGTDARYPSYFFIQTGVDTSTTEGGLQARAYIAEKFQGVYVIFKTNVGTHYQLTPTQLKSLKGTNNIWSNANGPVEILYWMH